MPVLVPVVQRLRARAQAEPDRPLFAFVGDDGREAGTLTQGELVALGAAIAAYLTGPCGLKAGSRVLLVYPPGLEFVPALLGCMWAGLVPVPVCPPTPGALAYDLTRLSAMATSSGARAILTTREYQTFKRMMQVKGALQSLLARKGADWPDLPWHTTDQVKPGPVPEPLVSDLAFLQYTSGSTSFPKGVRITQANLVHQLDLNRDELGMGPDSHMVTWVPHFHDFGLISGILSAMAGNGRLTFMSPVSFIRRPAVWLEVASRVKATHMAAPTFAYELVVRKTTAEQRARWDLSAVRVAMAAAEPVRPATMRAFGEAMAPAGFKPEALCPAYGLAEHTVGVTVFGRGTVRVERAALEREGRVAELADGLELRACGAPTADVVVRIVHPETLQPCAAGAVGEIWVDSPSKADGYDGLPDETRATFEAELGDGRKYLRTGDLGFLHHGQLYVTGRLKDLVIIRGRNLYPQDLEDSVVACHEQVRPGGVAAFAVDGPEGEDLVVFVELRDDDGPAEAVALAARQALLADHQVGCRAVVVGASGLVPKTTSGKVRRQDCRQAYLAGTRAPQHRHTASFDAQPAPRDWLDLDPAFQQLVAEAGKAFAGMAKARGGRVFHQVATALRGELRARPAAGVPANPFFAPGRTYPVLVRHANGVQADDAAVDNRGASMRVLDPAGGPLLDLLMSTGECFLQGTAEGFARWTAGPAELREAIATQHPHLGRAAWGMVRRADSFAALTYYSKVANHYQGAGYARFRLLPADRVADRGEVQPDGRPLPPDVFQREPGDERSRRFLHDDLQARLAAGPVRYVLQAQLQPASEQALDCTRPWTAPWLDLADLVLDAVEPDEAVRGLHFNPRHAPPELGLVLAASPADHASLNHMRAIVYELAACARTGDPLPAGLAAFLPPEPQAPSAPAPATRRIGVIGGGASGLTAAYQLEQLGHQVTVLEAGPDVGGKAASLALGGRAYDWGGHFCSANYKAVARLAAELGVETEPAVGSYPFSPEEGGRFAPLSPADTQQAWLRFIATRDRDFPSLAEPGLAGAARALSRPAGEWLAANGLADLGRAFGANYTSSGYGYLADPELAALYFLKGVEMVAGAAPGGDLPAGWTIKGGFQRLWDALAARLRDVRRGVEVVGVTRGAHGVTVRTRDGELAFDELVVATPLHGVPGYLDATPAECAVFGQVRHFSYFTTVFRAEGLSQLGFDLLAPHATGPRAYGHSVAIHHRYPGDDVYLAYAYGDADTDGARVAELLAEDMARLGGKLLGIEDQRRWDYFPHFRPADLADGIYDRLEALQGQQRTYFLGSLFNFELVDCNVAYATALVERFFTPRTVAASAGLALVRRAIAAELGTEPAPTAAFIDLGLDSIQTASLFSRLAAETGLAISPIALLDHPTVADLAAWIDGNGLTPAPAEAPAGLAHQGSQPYFERDGVNLHVEVFTPTGPSNGLAVIDVVSATWQGGSYILKYHLDYGVFASFAARGFTVFAISAGSLPRFDVYEQLHHVRRAIRWVKSRAGLYGIDPTKISLVGASSGAHLALLAAVTPAPDDPDFHGGAFDAEVAAVAAIGPLVCIDDTGDGQMSDVQRLLVHTDHGGQERTREERIRLMSPLAQLQGRCAPMLFFHALRDPVAPFAHTVAFAEALRGFGGRAEVVPRNSDLHEFQGMEADFPRAAAWIEHVLLGRGDMPDLAPYVAPRRAFTPLRATPRLRLYCFPPAGGDATAFEAWPDALPRHVEVQAVELPGRGSRADEPALASLEELLASLEAAIEDDTPFAFFGHSMGALLAFEVARRLRRARRAMPAHLFLSAFTPPRGAGPAWAPTEDELGRITPFMTPALAADLQLLGAWNQADEPPLAVPLTVLGGEDDPLAGPDALEGWRVHTTAAFELALYPGGHTYLEEATPAVLDLIRARLAPLAAAPIPAPLRAFAAAWRQAPSAYTGPLALYDLAQIARPADRGGSPLVPGALAALRARLAAGALARSPLPSSDFAAGAACLNTLARWEADPAGLAPLVAFTLDALARMATPDAPQPHAPGITIDESICRWLLPVAEAERLATCPALSEAQRATVSAAVGALGAWDRRAEVFGRDLATVFEQGPMLLGLAEHFPDEALKGSAALAHARRHGFIIGAAAPGTARFAELTRDSDAVAGLARLLARPADGLWPGGELPELVFSLAYLAQGGVDVLRVFGPEVARLQALVARGGVPATGGMALPDCDTTAVALATLHRLGVPAALPTRALERFWLEQPRCYLSHEGAPVPYVSTEAHVAEAAMLAPDLTPAEQRAIWERTVGLLEGRPWHDGTHLSPFYAWEAIAGLGFRHAARFPDVPAMFHRAALARILELQRPDGGFHSRYVLASNAEETGLALLAMQAARAAGPDEALDQAIARAVTFLQGWRGQHPPLWLGKTLTAATHVIEAIRLAALATAPAAKVEQPLRGS